MLRDSAARDGLPQREHTRARATEKALETVADYLRNAVTLNLRVAIMEYVDASRIGRAHGTEDGEKVCVVAIGETERTFALAKHALHTEDAILASREERIADGSEAIRLKIHTALDASKLIIDRDMRATGLGKHCGEVWKMKLYARHRDGFVGRQACNDAERNNDAKDEADGDPLAHTALRRFRVQNVRS